jgi:ectoine hydroxylase-related dioxygenase (phytanoyl-CoA dioxygenase family)
MGANMARIDAVVPHFERVYCEMKPGSVVYFHCNTLHTSAPNESDHPRRSFIICYNAASNLALNRSQLDTPCPTGNEDGILKFA